MNIETFNAIVVATTDKFPKKCWYLDSEINRLLSDAEKNGWIRRPSVTQVEWTDLGIATAIENDLCNVDFNTFHKKHKQVYGGDFGIYAIYSEYVKGGDTFRTIKKMHTKDDDIVTYVSRLCGWSLPLTDFMIDNFWK